MTSNLARLFTCVFLLFPIYRVQSIERVCLACIIPGEAHNSIIYARNLLKSEDWNRAVRLDCSLGSKPNTVTLICATCHDLGMHKMMDENLSSRCVVCSAVRASDVCPVDWMRPLVICEYLGLAHVTLPVEFVRWWFQTDGSFFAFQNRCRQIFPIWSSAAERYLIEISPIVLLID